MKRLALALLFLAGCGDFRDPGDLRYARTLAVRADPPWVPADERARIELLVTGNDGVPMVRAPEMVTLAPPEPGRPVAPAEAMTLIAHQSEGWYVSAPSAEVLAQLRQALSLPADAPVPLPLSVSATIDGQLRPSEKIVWLGGASSNPTITGMTIDGRPMEDGSLVAVPAAGTHTLTGTATGEGTLSYSWYSAFGELKKYREPTATFEKAEPGQMGAVVLVVRNDRGGVTWRFGSLKAE